MSEKRRYMRFDVLLNALCRSNGVLKGFKLSNFSRDGFGFVSKESLDKGKDVEIEFSIPGDNVPIIASGQIAWASRLDQEDKFEGGLRIKKINNHDRGRILNHIYEKWMDPNISG